MGRKHSRFINAHSQKGQQESEGPANNQKILLVHYTLGMKVAMLAYITAWQWALDKGVG